MVRPRISHQHNARAPIVDRLARTEPARQAALAKFEDQVDPERKLSEEERERRALSARRAHFRGLALRSAGARARGSRPIGTGAQGVAAGTSGAPEARRDGA